MLLDDVARGGADYSQRVTIATFLDETKGPFPVEPQWRSVVFQDPEPGETYLVRCRGSVSIAYYTPGNEWIIGDTHNPPITDWCEIPEFSS